MWTTNVWLKLALAGCALGAVGCGDGSSRAAGGEAGSAGAAGAAGTGPGDTGSGGATPAAGAAGAAATGGGAGSPAATGGSATSGGAAGSGTAGVAGALDTAGAAGTAGAVDVGGTAGGPGGDGGGGGAVPNGETAGDGGAGDAGDGGAGTAGSTSLWESLTCGWQLLGDRVSDPSAESEDPALLLLDGNPVVGYRQASFELRLHPWDGSGWGASASDPAGGELASLFYRAPDFCADGGEILTAFTLAGDAAASDESFYDRVFGFSTTDVASWSALDAGDEISQHWDSVEQVGYDAGNPTIACGGGLAPAVAWIETDLAAEGDDDVHVAQMAGGTFSSFPRINRVTASGTPALVADVELSPAGEPFVAHFELAEDASFTSNLYVTRLDGGVTPIGGSIDSDQDTNQLSAPSLWVNGPDDLYVAYSADRDGSGQRQIYVVHWDGADWGVLGGGPVTAFPTDHFDSGNPDLILVDGTPVVAWDEANEYEGHFIYVARFDGSGWPIICDALNVDPARDARDPSLGYAASTQTLYAAFEENVDGYPEIFVRELALGD